MTGKPTVMVWSHYTDQLAVVSDPTLAESFDREQLFFAANRVEACADQCAQMRFSWQASMRTLIDVIEMPSMSVGDRYVLLSEANTAVAWQECGPYDWRDFDRDDMAALVVRAEQEGLL